MKVVIIFLTLIISGLGHTCELPKNVKVACKSVFNSDILATFEGTNVENARMSSRQAYKCHEAKAENHILMEIAANFYVKWPENEGEVRALAGGRYVYDTELEECRSINLAELFRLKLDK